MEFVYYIVFTVIFIPLLIGFRRLTQWVFDKIENYLPSIITMPLIFLAFSKVIQFYILEDINNDELGWFPSLFFIFFLLSMYALVYLFEKTGTYMCQQQKVWKFFLYVILSIFSLAMIFAWQYDLLYAYYDDSFTDVPKGKWWEITLDFFFYSFGILFANSISSIECVSIWAKILTSVEVLFSFILLVFFISYYKEIGELFHSNKEEKEHDLSHVQECKPKKRHDIKAKHIRRRK